MRLGKVFAAAVSKLYNHALTNAGYRGFVGLEYEEPQDPYDAIPRVYDELRAAS